MGTQAGTSALAYVPLILIFTSYVAIFHLFEIPLSESTLLLF